VLFPFAYVVKIAGATSFGVLAAMYSLFAATDPTVTAAGAAVGVFTFSAGVWKLLSDHTAQKALRDSLEARIARLEDALKDERMSRVQWQTAAVQAQSELAILKARDEEGGR